MWTYLALRSQRHPSFVLFRGVRHRRPDTQLAVLLANLDAIRADLDQGSIVVFEDARIRIRPLPISSP